LGGLTLTVAFIGEEEEGLVAPVVEVRNEDGAADSDTELILPQRIDRGEEVIPGVEGRVAEELPDGAVELVGAALGDDVDDAAGDLAELGKVVMGLHLELLNVIDDGLVVVVADEGAEVGYAIEQEHIAAIARSIHRRKGEGADGLAGKAAATARVLAYADRAYAWGELKQFSKVSSVEGQVIDGPGGDDGAELGGG
jgi:hypothetical protein